MLLNSDFDAPLWRHRWRHIVKMTWFFCFFGQGTRSWNQNEDIFKTDENRKMTFFANFDPIRASEPEVEPEVEGSPECAFRYATFQFLFRCSTLNINRVIAIWKFRGFCDLVNSTFDLPSRKTIHIISGQGNNWWCRLVKISQSVRELSRSERTHRQTDTQTVKRTYLPKMKFWQVMKEQSHTWLPDVPKLLLNDIVLTYTL